MGPEAGTPTPSRRRTAISRSGSTTIASMASVAMASSMECKELRIYSPFVSVLVARLGREIEDVRRHHLPAHRFRQRVGFDAPLRAVGLGDGESAFHQLRDGRLILLRHIRLQALLNPGRGLEKLRPIGGGDRVPCL